MNGIVNADLELSVDLFIQGPNGETRMTAIIDTGYNGFLSLPFPVIAALASPNFTPRVVILSDGTRRISAFYELKIDWDGQYMNVQALCMPGEAVIGTALLKGYKLEADFVRGGLVRIVRI